MRELFPDGGIKHGIYYHSFIDNYDGNEVRFKDDRKLDAAGNHINYGGRYTYDRLYVPTLDNEFGKETAKVIDVILDEDRRRRHLLGRVLHFARRVHLQQVGRLFGRHRPDHGQDRPQERARRPAQPRLAGSTGQADHGPRPPGL